MNQSSRSERVLDLLGKLKAPGIGAEGSVVSRRQGMSKALIEKTPGEDAIRPSLDTLSNFLVGPNPEAAAVPTLPSILDRGRLQEEGLLSDEQNPNLKTRFRQLRDQFPVSASEASTSV